MSESLGPIGTVELPGSEQTSNLANLYVIDRDDLARIGAYVFNRESWIKSAKTCIGVK